MKNKFEHHLKEFVMGKRLSLCQWQKEQNKINKLKNKQQ